MWSLISRPCWLEKTFWLDTRVDTVIRASRVLILEAQTANYTTGLTTLCSGKLKVVETSQSTTSHPLFFLAFTPHWAQITLKVPLASLSMQYMVSQGSGASEKYFYFASPKILCSLRKFVSNWAVTYQTG